MQYFNSNTIIFLNGRFEKASGPAASLYGQSLHYGYSVFDGMRAYNTHNGTRIFKARQHFERLEQAAQLLNIPFKWNIDELLRKAYKLLEMNGLKDAYIRPLVFCGPNMSLTAPVSSSIMICAWKWDAYLGHEPLNVCISGYERPSPRSFPVQAKVSGNYVNAILATQEAKSKGFDEALLLDEYGNVAQAPGANIFMEKNGRLYTPPEGHIVPGITRATVRELCLVLDIELTEKHLDLQELYNADSAFFCGTATEIAGIGRIEGYRMPMKWEDSIGAVIQRTYQSLVLEKQNYEVII